MGLSFFSRTCRLQNVKHSKMIGRGNLHEDLYVIDVDYIDFKCQLVDRTCIYSTHMAHVVSKHTWHNRLAHISFHKMENLKDLLNYKTLWMFLIPHVTS